MAAIEKRMSQCVRLWDAVGQVDGRPVLDVMAEVAAAKSVRVRVGRREVVMGRDVFADVMSKAPSCWSQRAVVPLFSRQDVQTKCMPPRPRRMPHL